MDAFLSAAYPWVKSLHVISVIAWMAGLLYLPRLYVYHSATQPGSEMSETFKVMERRLLRAIMNPAQGGAFIFGIMLLLTPGIIDWSAGWIWVKLAMVALLTWAHHAMAQWRKEFDRDERVRTTRFFRFMNEVPTLAMIVIVFMVIARPL